jgi:hypothetical protein
MKKTSWPPFPFENKQKVTKKLVNNKRVTKSEEKKSHAPPQGSY